MTQPNYRQAGINPFGYMGVEALTPPDLTIRSFNPTIDDSNFNIGIFWVTRDPAPITIWMLVDLNQGNATWAQLYPGGSGAAGEFPTNNGVANAMGGVLNIFGTNLITTSASGNTVTIHLINGSNGQTIIGGGSSPEWKDLTSSDGSITITNGANTIDIATTSTSPVIKQIDTDSGTVTPASGIIEIIGGELINTSGSTNIVKVNLDRGTDGQIPIAATGAATIYAKITSADSTVEITNGTNSIDLSDDSGSGDVNPAASCNFLMYLSTNTSTGGSGIAAVFLGQYGVLTKKYDVGGNCYVGSGSGGSSLNPSNAATFTAPATGKYFIGANVTTGNASSSAGQFVQAVIIADITSGYGYNFDTISVSTPPPYPLILGRNSANIVDLKAGDKVGIFYSSAFPGGFYTAGGGVTNLVTFFWGYRLV